MKLYEIQATIKGRSVNFNSESSHEFMARVIASNTFFCQVEDVAIQSITAFDVVHLQGIGKVRAKPAAEFEPSERMGYNHSYAYIVFKTVKETTKTITYRLVSLSGTSYERTFKKTQLVAIAEGNNWR